MAATNVSAPPSIGCPEWCTHDHNEWDTDGSDFVRDHSSAELASPGATYSLTLYALDWFNDGVLQVGNGHVTLRLEDEILEPADAARLAVDLPKAEAAASVRTRRVAG